MKTYLVTGAAGFIGSNITEALLQQGYSVRGIDNFSTGKKENIQELLQNPKFEFVEGDITDLEAAKKAVKGIDFVLHEAAVPSVPRSIDNPIRSNNANVNGTLNMLVAARDEKVKRFVYASSSSIYGDNPELPKREDFPVRPISPYSLTKYAGERYCQIFYQIYGLPTICLRYFNVFGPKQDPASQYSAVIPKFIGAFLKGEPITIFGDGTHSRDFTFIQNVVSANLLAAVAEKGFGEVMNAACGGETSLNELIGYLREISGKEVPVLYQENRQGDVPHSRADISKAGQLIGYKSLVTIKEGLKKTFEWYAKP